MKFIKILKSEMSSCTSTS